jgi:hypothetical protein
MRLDNMINLFYSILVLSVLVCIGQFANSIPIHPFYWVTWLAALFWMVQVTFDNSAKVGYDLMGILIDKI